MAATRELPEPTVGYRWVKANVYAALVNSAISFAITAVGKALALSDPDAGTVTAIMFVAVGSLLAAAGYAVFARLTGEALSRKLPLFPIRTWIALHVVLGFAVGLLISLSATLPPEIDPEPMEFEMGLAILIGGAIIGMLIEAIIGSLQALVLRKAVRNVGAWIGYSMLAGTALGPLALIGLLPGTGLGSDVLPEITGFMLSVLIAIIMLPAVRRLQPREAASPARAAPPPP